MYCMRQTSRRCFNVCLCYIGHFLKKKKEKKKVKDVMKMLFLRRMLIAWSLKCCFDWRNARVCQNSLFRSWLTGARCALMLTDVAMVTHCFPARAITHNRWTSLFSKLTTGKMCRIHRSSPKALSFPSWRLSPSDVFVLVRRQAITRFVCEL